MAALPLEGSQRETPRLHVRFSTGKSRRRTPTAKARRDRRGAVYSWLEWAAVQLWPYDPVGEHTEELSTALVPHLVFTEHGQGTESSRSPTDVIGVDGVSALFHDQASDAPYALRLLAHIAPQLVTPHSLITTRVVYRADVETARLPGSELNQCYDHP